ncbi:MAG TPA: hypothetical protein DDW52_12690 [Planctomycetaceae bacterium]|nr:hypothetical protein [Planctomycetaceae bacterium]
MSNLHLTRNAVWGQLAVMAMACSLVCVYSPPASLAGQMPADTKKESPKKDTSDKSASEDASEDDSEDDSDTASGVLAIVGGDVITVTRETIRGGTILIEDGKITALGNDIEVPKNAETIDASGQVITPGFISLNASRVGLRSSSDSSAKYADSLDPFDNNVRLAVGIGITTTCQKVTLRSGGSRGGRSEETLAGSSTNLVADGFPITERFPGLDPDLAQLALLKPPTETDYGEFISTCPCCGLPILPTEPLATPAPKPLTTQGSVVVKMSYGVLDDMLLRENVFFDTNSGALIGANNQRNWRGQIELARKYLTDQAEHEKATAAGKKVKPPRKPVKDDVLRLVKGEIAMRIPANSVSEMKDILLLAEELDYKVVIDGAAESWVIGRKLAEADASVILTPRRRRNAQFGAEDRTGTWIETTRVMEGQGVPFAITSLSGSISLNGLAGRDLTSLPLEAAFAVRGGATERAALAALTIVPARMMGLEDRIGSLEVGKDADILILNGPPLDYRTYVETAIVNGHRVYDRGQARVLPVYDK